MQELKLGIGEKIFIAKKSFPDTAYSSKIISIENESLTVMGPMHQGRFIYMPTGTEAIISYVVEEKGIFGFDAVVTSLSTEEGYALTIKKTSDVFAKQLRENFRVASRVPLKVSLNDLFDGKDGKLEATETVDISAGGIRFYSNLDIKEQQPIYLLMTIRNVEIPIKALVVRRWSSQNMAYRSAYGVYFTEILEAHRDIIIKHLFDCQRQMSSEGRKI